MAKALIMGCGNIGYRHFQSLAANQDFDEIHILEPQESRLRECVDGELKPQTTARIQGHRDSATLVTPNSPEISFDLVISAVTADRQLEVVEMLAQLSSMNKFRIKNILLEKPLCQSLKNIEKIQHALQGLNVLVNCPMPIWPGYSNLTPLLSGLKRFHMEVQGAQWGFACNAIHYIDLFRHFTHAKSITCTDSALSSAPFPSKRGERFEEYSGAISFVTEKGHTLSISCSQSQETPPFVTLRFSIPQHPAPRFLFWIDENGSKIHALDPDWKSISGDLGVQYVSQTTSLIWKRISSPDSNPVSPIPHLSESIISHRALFDAFSMGTGKTELKIT